MPRPPSIGPICAALMTALTQTPQRFRTKRQLWTYSGLGIETHDSVQYRYVEGRSRCRPSRGVPDSGYPASLAPLLRNQHAASRRQPVRSHAIAGAQRHNHGPAVHRSHPARPTARISPRSPKPRPSPPHSQPSSSPNYCPTSCRPLRDSQCHLRHPSPDRNVSP